MREILFRGQTRKHGQKVNMAGEKLPGIWVYGGIFPGTGDYSVIYGSTDTDLSVGTVEKYVVWSDTVGQFTGLCDVKKQNAFEHDVVKYHFGNEVGVIRYGTYRNPFGDDSFGGHIGFYVDWISGDAPQILRKDLAYWMNIVEIVGNIHDNPELLEVQENV